LIEASYRTKLLRSEVFLFISEVTGFTYITRIYGTFTAHRASAIKAGAQANAKAGWGAKFSCKLALT